MCSQHGCCFFCASARVCFQIRVVRPSAAVQFAESHNGTLWQCLSNILQVDLNQCDEVVRDVATLPLSMGGLGLRSAVRVRSPACWASWADCLPMMQARHPRVVAEILAELGDRSASPCLEEVRRAAWDLFGVMGFEPPPWYAVVNGARPAHDGEQEPGSFERGWQHEASSRVERQHREVNLFPRLSEAGRALVRSQAGPGSGLALSTCPTCRITSLDSHLFRVLLLRRLQLPSNRAYLPVWPLT